MHGGEPRASDDKRAGRALTVAVLSGGVGGARFLRGLVAVLGEPEVAVVANVGDDAEILGLHVSPDLDSILYALTGVADEARGWGRAEETWNALEAVGRAGGDTWFRLGDRDIGLQLVRTQALRRGEPLSAVTARIASSFGLGGRLLPATDDPLRTWVETEAGSFPLQHWFVGRAQRDEVVAVRFEGAERARPAPGVLDALEGADAIVVAPSNPHISILPILAVREIRAALERRRAPAVAISPLIGGEAIKGPAARMLARLEGGTSAAHVARAYRGLVDALVFDEADAADADAVAALGVRPVVARTLMRDDESRRRLAAAALEAVGLARAR